MSVDGGMENDTVANWAGLGTCGDSTAVINVTVPSDTAQRVNGVAEPALTCTAIGRIR